MHIKQRMTVMTSALVVLTLGVGGVLGIPSILAINETLTEISAAQAKLDDRYAINRFLTQAADDIAAKKARVIPLQDAAIHEGGELAFVKAIETAAADARVEQKITLETADQKEISSWEREVPVSISVTGDYKNVLSFLDAIERMPYLLDITAMNVVPGKSTRYVSDDPKGGGVTIDFRAVVLWLGNDAPSFVTGKAPLPAAKPAPVVAPTP